MNSLLTQNQVVYSADTSSLVEACRILYPMENFPSLWHEIEELIRADRLKMSEIALEEAMKNQVLENWYREEKSRSILKCEVEEIHQKEVRIILSKYPGMLKVKKNTSGADPWVVAVAKQYIKGVVVTEEKSTGDQNNPRIPDVCKDLGIECINIAGLVTKENWVF